MVASECGITMVDRFQTLTIGEDEKVAKLI
jgi:hypothetical protein